MCEVFSFWPQSSCSPPLPHIRSITRTTSSWPVAVASQVGRPAEWPVNLALTSYSVDSYGFRGNFNWINLNCKLHKSARKPTRFPNSQSKSSPRPKGTPHDSQARRHRRRRPPGLHGPSACPPAVFTTANLGGITVSPLELERIVDGHPAVYESAAVAVQPDGKGP